MYKKKQKDRLLVLIATSILTVADIIVFNMLSPGYVLLCAIATSLIFGLVIECIEPEGIGSDPEEICVAIFFAYLLKPIALVWAIFMLISDHLHENKKVKSINNTKFWT